MNIPYLPPREILRYTARVIWLVFWLAFTLFIVWLFAQSMRTVMRQQKSWELFARKHNMIYQRPFWYKAPNLEGIIKGRRLRVYVEERIDPVRRIREFRTTLEVYFNESFPTGLGIGSRSYHELLRDIENVENLVLPVEQAFAGLVAVGRDVDVAREYIQTHVEPLKKFFGTPKSERLMMGHETDGFLVLQTGDTLEDVKALNDCVRRLFAIAEDLEPETGDKDNKPLAFEGENALESGTGAPVAAEETAPSIENPAVEEVKEDETGK